MNRTMDETALPARARVADAWRSSYPQPLRVRAGEIIGLGARDEEWPAVAWVTRSDGHAGWMPHAWLRPLGDGRAEALRDYDARELNADAGSVVALLHEHGGWWWAERADGTRGWLPERHLQPLDTDSP